MNRNDRIALVSAKLRQEDGTMDQDLADRIAGQAVGLFDGRADLLALLTRYAKLARPMSAETLSGDEGRRTAILFLFALAGIGPKDWLGETDER